MFCLFTDCKRWKWASSLKKTSVMMHPRSASHAFSQGTKSCGLNSCTTAICRDEILVLHKGFASQNEQTAQQQLHVCRQNAKGITKQKALPCQCFGMTLLFMEAQVFFHFFTLPVSWSCLPMKQSTAGQEHYYGLQYWNGYRMHIAWRWLRDYWKNMPWQWMCAPPLSTPWC